MPRPPIVAHNFSCDVCSSQGRLSGKTQRTHGRWALGDSQRYLSTCLSVCLSVCLLLSPSLLLAIALHILLAVGPFLASLLLLDTLQAAAERSETHALLSFSTLEVCARMLAKRPEVQYFCLSVCLPPLSAYLASSQSVNPLFSPFSRYTVQNDVRMPSSVSDVPSQMHPAVLFHSNLPLSSCPALA